MRRVGGISVFVVILAMMACGTKDEWRPAARLGVPPQLETLFAAASWPGSPPFSAVPLRPYERAHDLEILLLSTHSTAFDGIVVQARFAPLFSQWTKPFPKSMEEGLRPDLAASLEGQDGLLALPLTVDAPVLVYRKDLWRKYFLPEPSNLAGLREDMIALRSWRKESGQPLCSSVPETLLFWSLAASFDGENSSSLYSSSKVHVLRFLNEFGLKTKEPRDAWNALASGQAAAAFMMASQAASLWREDGPLGQSAAVAPLPSAFGAMAVNDGWCVVGESLPAQAPGVAKSLVSYDFQAAVSKAGFLPVLATAPKPDGAAFTALSRTKLISFPIGWEEGAFLRQAIADVLEGNVDSEEALRRAEARRVGMPSP
jgi:ABC-type glycerol-3-phosphate transport system substrate-binding protein